MDFHKILYLRILGKSSEKIQVLLQSDKNNGFSWNFIFEDFSKIFRENSSFITIWQE